MWGGSEDWRPQTTLVAGRGTGRWRVVIVFESRRREVVVVVVVVVVVSSVFGCDDDGRLWLQS